MATTPRRGLWLILAGLVLAAVTGWALYRDWKRQRFEEYSGIDIHWRDSLLEVDDEWSFAFLDGHYAAIVKLDAGSISRILGQKPAWAGGGWVPGRGESLARRLAVTDDGSLVSITGVEGSAVHRAITIRQSDRTLYFELKAE